MLIHCPECDTCFRIGPEHLAAAEGKVRCGQCDHIFDATEQLATSLLETDKEPVAEPEIASTATVPNDTNETAPPTAPPSSLPQSYPRRPSALSTFFWSLGVLMLLALLIGQWLWWDREQLAAHPDGLKIVQWMCQYAPCKATPPRAPEQIDVLSRSLAPNADAPQALDFNLEIVSKARQPQPYPIIELHLFDAMERSAAAGRFKPSDYLPSAAEHDLLLPDMPVQLKLTMANPGSHVVGFKIDFL